MIDHYAAAPRAGDGARSMSRLADRISAMAPRSGVLELNNPLPCCRARCSPSTCIGRRSFWFSSRADLAHLRSIRSHAGCRGGGHEYRRTLDRTGPYARFRHRLGRHRFRPPTASRLYSISATARALTVVADSRRSAVSARADADRLLRCPMCSIPCASWASRPMRSRCGAAPITS